MGEACEKPDAPATPEVAATAAPAPPLDEGLDDDILRLLGDFPVPVLGRDAKQGGKEGVEGQEGEEELEELEWLNDKDAFPELDTSLTFDPTLVSSAASVLDAPIGCLYERLEAETARVPRKKRSPIPRRPRQVFYNQDIFQSGEENGIETSVRRCSHCLVTKTPQWRQGPDGPGTLCNACGVRYKSGRLCNEYRPANSPTFSLGKHSNFHRKVLEMRGKQKDGGRR